MQDVQTQEQEQEQGNIWSFRSGLSESRIFVERDRGHIRVVWMERLIARRKLAWTGKLMDLQQIEELSSKSRRTNMSSRWMNDSARNGME